MLKQITSRKLRPVGSARFWQIRYYDFPVWSEKKRIEKLRYIHRNPVKRGLAQSPEDWRWSSFLQWATGSEGRVEVECPSTALRRERMGMGLTVARIPSCRSKTGSDKDGATEVTVASKGSNVKGWASPLQNRERQGWGNPSYSCVERSNLKGWASPVAFERGGPGAAPIRSLAGRNTWEAGEDDRLTQVTFPLVLRIPRARRSQCPPALWS